MQLVADIPFPALAFRQFDLQGKLDCIVAVRGTFVHRQNEALEPCETMEPFIYEDVYAGDPHTSSLVRQSDLTPEKPGTDVTFLGSSFAPDGRPAVTWDCALRVGSVAKSLRVTGKRSWKPETKRTWKGLFERDPAPVLTGWRLSQPEPAEAVSLDWTNAFGGPLPAPDGATPDVHRSNPLGPGLLDIGLGHRELPVPAAQIESPDRPIADWRDRDLQPEGFGPISPWWHPRQRHAGTYDEQWLAERHPLLPLDFDPRFWQSAHPDLVAVPHLVGDEEYELINLHRLLPHATGRLPALRLNVTCANGDVASEGRHPLVLDGVHFDFRNENACVMLTWRARFPLNEPERAVLTLRVEPHVDLAELQQNALDAGAST